MDWDAFRDQVKDWSLHNFGEQTSLRPFIGMIEELGELVVANNSGARFDAVGDVLIYMADFTGRRGIPLADIVLNPLNKPRCFAAHQYQGAYNLLVRIIGKASHAVLKMEQQIRVDEDHATVLVDALREVVLWVRGQMADTSLEALDKTVSMVWEQVRNRNWKENAVDGSSSAS